MKNQRFIVSSVLKILISLLIAFLMTACSTEDAVNSSNDPVPCGNQGADPEICTDPGPTPDPTPAPDPTNHAPSTASVTLDPIAEDSGVRIITQAMLLLNASDVDGDSLAATGLGIISGTGTLLDNNDGTWNYAPVANDDTSVTFVYTVTDGALSTAGTANLDITPQNDSPTSSSVVLDSIVENSGARIITQAELLANASDVDGDSLTATGLFIASGMGALVDNRDGTWSYTPALNDDAAVGFGYSVTDGVSPIIGTASLDITPLTDLTLSWVAPVTREDNSPLLLSEISGYRIYYGIAPNVYPIQVDINDGSADQAILNNMAPGTYYFVVTTVDMDGRESDYSTMVSKSI